MSRNARETRLPADLLDDVRFVALSVSARLVYLTLRMLADDEGRLVASPAILEANGRLQGLGVAGIVAALSEVNLARLVGLYTFDGREYAFLPDTFANPGGIRYWSRSACPLPPAETLALFPDYTNALARLDAHARLGFKGEPWSDRRDAPRYARELWPALWRESEAQHHEQSRSARVERDSAGQCGATRDMRHAGAGAVAGAGAGALSSEVGEVLNGGGVFEGGRRRQAAASGGRA